MDELEEEIIYYSDKILYYLDVLQEYFETEDVEITADIMNPTRIDEYNYVVLVKIKNVTDDLSVILNKNKAAIINKLNEILEKYNVKNKIIYFSSTSISFILNTEKNISDIPFELFTDQLLLSLDIQSIKSFCSASASTKYVCDNKIFWNRIFALKYPMIYDYYKSLYSNNNNIITVLSELEVYKAREITTNIIDVINSKGYFNDNLNNIKLIDSLYILSNESQELIKMFMFDNKITDKVWGIYNNSYIMSEYVNKKVETLLSLLKIDKIYKNTEFEVLRNIFIYAIQNLDYKMLNMFDKRGFDPIDEIVVPNGAKYEDQGFMIDALLIKNRIDINNKKDSKRWERVLMLLYDYDEILLNPNILEYIGQYCVPIKLLKRILGDIKKVKSGKYDGFREEELKLINSDLDEHLRQMMLYSIENNCKKIYEYAILYKNKRVYFEWLMIRAIDSQYKDVILELLRNKKIEKYRTLASVKRMYERAKSYYYGPDKIKIFAAFYKYINR
jgi:hypothetical protein